jgi:M6 family metalloprotease-like protein
VPWARTSVSKLLADGDTYGLGSTSSLGIALLEALQKADATVDFSRYDSNRDGFVDAVAFEYLEIAASCGNRGIWPHRSGIGNWNGGAPFTTNDVGVGGQPVKVDGYIIQSVADCTGKSVQTAATMAHEYGHVLGFPDFYHAIGGVEPENRRWVLGCWELMAAGSWGCGPVTNRVNFGPTHMLAQQKSVMGWAELQNVGEVWDSLFVLDPIQTSGRALRVPMDSTGAEALVIEYRPRTGFDAQIPAAGILISKLDSRGSLRPTNGSVRYSNVLLEADGNGALVRNHEQGGNRGEAGDAFAVGGATSKLSFMSPTPLIRNLTGQASWVTIHSMQVVDGKARIRVSSSRTPKVNSPTTPFTGKIATRFVQSARVMGGYMPYAVASVEGAPAGLTASAVEDDVLLNGVPMASGAYSVLIRLTDARGARFDLRMPVTIAPYVADQAQLLAPFLHTVADPLPVEERTYLDSSGNKNGTFDVGDLRAWLTKP